MLHQIMLRLDSLIAGSYLSLFVFTGRIIDLVIGIVFLMFAYAVLKDMKK